MIGQFTPGAGLAGGGLGDLPGGHPLSGLHPDPAGHMESGETQKCGLCVKIKTLFWTRKVSGDCDRKKKILRTNNTCFYDNKCFET